MNELTLRFFEHSFEGRSFRVYQPTIGELCAWIDWQSSNASPGRDPGQLAVDAIVYLFCRFVEIRDGSSWLLARDLAAMHAQSPERFFSGAFIFHAGSLARELMEKALNPQTARVS